MGVIIGFVRITYGPMGNLNDIRELCTHILREQLQGNNFLLLSKMVPSHFPHIVCYLVGTLSLSEEG